MRTELAELLDRVGVVTRREHPTWVSALKRSARAGEIEAVFPGVYIPAGAGANLDIALRAVVAWNPDAVVTGWAAARITFWPAATLDAVDVAVAHHRAPRPGFRFTRRTIPDDLISQRGPLRITMPALTAIDLSLETDGGSIDEVLRCRAATIDRLRAALESTKGRRGNRRRRQLLLDSRAEPWSAAERRCHVLLREAGISGWRANHRVSVRDQTYYIDIAFPGLRLAIEIDGRRYHGEDTFESDRHRQNALVLEGWQVLRFTWAMLLEDPDRVMREIRAAIAARGRMAG